MSTTSQNDSVQARDLASGMEMMSGDSVEEAASRESQHVQEGRLGGQDGDVDERVVGDHSTVSTDMNTIPGQERAATGHETKGEDGRDGETDRAPTTTAISSAAVGGSSTARRPHSHSAVPTNTPTDPESEEGDVEGRTTTTASLPCGGPVASSTDSVNGETFHNHSVVPTIKTTGSESEEEDRGVQEGKQDKRDMRGEEQDLTTTTTSTTRGNPGQSSTGQSLRSRTLRNHSAVPTNTPTGYESQEENDEESQATPLATDERRFPGRLNFHGAVRGQSAHSLDSSNSAITPAISTASATVSDGEDMDGRATPRDDLLPWSGGSIVSNEEGNGAISTAGATISNGDVTSAGDVRIDVREVTEMLLRAEDENEERSRHNAVSGSTEDGDSHDGRTFGDDNDDTMSGAGGSDLDFELTLDPVTRNGRRMVSYANPRELDHFHLTQTITWHINRPPEEQPRDLHDASDIPFTPQTPTHTPVVPAHLSRGALAADHLIPALSLAADHSQEMRGENRPEASNSHNHPGDRRDLEYRPDGLTLTLSDANDRDHSWHVVNGPNRVLPGPNDRIDLRLPNPENLPTFQLLVTVPYRSRATWPISASFVLPPEQGREYNVDQTGLLNVEVERAEIWQNNDVDIAIHDGLRETSPTAQFVAQLPQVPLTEILDPRDRECPVCREVFATGTEEVAQGEQMPERPVRTPCNHIVGNQCLLRWLFGEPGYPPHDTCPSCRGHLGIPQSPESRQREPAEPHDFDDGLVVEQSEAPNQETITDEELERQLLTHLRNWRPAAERGSHGRADQSSWDHMRHRNATAARDAALAQELIPTAIYNAIPTYEAEQHLLFEAVRLHGFLRYPYIPLESHARRHMTDEQLYEYLRSRGGPESHLYNSVGM